MIRALLALLYVYDFMIDDYRIDDFIRGKHDPRYMID